MGWPKKREGRKRRRRMRSGLRQRAEGMGPDWSIAPVGFCHPLMDNMLVVLWMNNILVNSPVWCYHGNYF